MTIELVDTSDGHAWHEWYEPVLAVELEAWPDDPVLGEEALRALHRGNEYVDHVHLVARAGDGGVVGSASVELSLQDNAHVASIEVNVGPQHRGRGHGRALLEATEQLAAERGRTVLIANTFGVAATVESRPARFAHAAGYRVARHEVRRDLALPLEPGFLDRLHAANAPAAMDYEFVGWWNRCPDDLIAGLARLSGTLSADEPRGDLDVESQVWDEARVRQWETTRAELGRELSSVGAVERRSNAFVAVTEIGMPPQGQDLARQFMTVVAPEHRGHRLGILTKIANLRQVESREIGIRRICTWNAEANREMVRVNAELGFEIAGRGFNWQKSLPR
jgi:GNAT superfamily N-acetyltransferase